MAERIRVRTYNVRFGDAILVTVPDRDAQSGVTSERNILIDVGNVLSKDGGDDSVFAAIVEDVLDELDGRPLDLYVMTHEHLDHVQGLFHAAEKIHPPGELKAKLDVQFAWLTASAAEDYYQTHPDARREKKLYDDAYDRIAAHLALFPASEAIFGALLANNNPRKTSDCVKFLRGLAAHTAFVSRGFDLDGHHPFREAKFRIWAPEEDTSSYYKALLPMAFGPAALGPAGAGERPVPPPGVDAGAFYDLVDFRERGFADNLLAIDRAANDSSVVFSLEWRGKRLLFAGDAELRSWRMMRDQGVLEPVDFLKVSHHGSHNGTPDDDVLDLFLPGKSNKRRAVVSTWQETYGGIPHEPTNEKLRARCKLRSILDAPDKLFFDTFISPA